MEHKMTEIKKEETPKKEHKGISSAFIERVIAAQKQQHEAQSS
jgi:hypothetical protein